MKNDRDLSLIDRFVKRVVVDANGCWLWQGSLVHGGYPRFIVNRESVRAHRWAYEHWVGPIPEGLTIDHLCRVRHCVNPAHMEPVTIQENLRRRPR